MKVITLYQPWASLIVDGYKTIETRLHNKFKSLKGQRILIHAGMKWDNNAELGELQKLDIAHKPYNEFGAILGSAFVSDFRELTKEDSKDALIDCGETRRYGLILTDIIKFDEPIPAKGKQGIWNYE